MLSEKYLKMTQLSSSIGLAYRAALQRAAEIGGENVFDYSMGNPSVPPRSSLPMPSWTSCAIRRT